MLPPGPCHLALAALAVAVHVQIARNQRQSVLVGQAAAASAQALRRAESHHSMPTGWTALRVIIWTSCSWLAEQGRRLARAAAAAVEQNQALTRQRQRQHQAAAVAVAAAGPAAGSRRRTQKPLACDPSSTSASIVEGASAGGPSCSPLQLDHSLARLDDVYIARAWQHQQRLLAWVRGDKFMQWGRGRLRPPLCCCEVLKEGAR